MPGRYGTVIGFTANDVNPVLSQNVGTTGAGEPTIPRLDVAASTVTCTSQAMRVAYFTASKSETIATVGLVTGSTAAGATPTICRVGIYLAGTDGALTSLAASTTNDTALFAAATTRYTKALTASFDKVAGQRYGVGVLVVTAAAAPTLCGNDGSPPSALTDTAPKMAAMVTGQANLPASVVVGGLSASGSMPYVELLP